MSDAVKRFNGLNGAVVDRSEVRTLISDAREQGQPHLARRLQSVLDSYAYERFRFEIDRPEIEALDLSDADGFDRTAEDGDFEGLAKAVTPAEIYAMITQKFLDALGKPLEFEQEWGAAANFDGGYVIAYNFDSGKPYRGINALILGSMFIYDPTAALLSNPYYMTFKQIEAHGGKIRKGAHAQRVIYYTELHRFENAEADLHFASYDRTKVVAYCEKHGQDVRNIDEIPIPKYYNVFNGADIEGIDFDLANFPGKGYIKPTTKAIDRKPRPVPVAEAIIESYPNPAPKIKIGGDDAFYLPSTDTVHMPQMWQFNYIQAYYTTFFHELVHSTSSPKRLARTVGKKHGDAAYSFEELVAEIGASFLSAEAGMLHYTFRNSAAYIKGWRARLVKLLKSDNKAIFRASAAAQRAADFMLDRDVEGLAAYEKRLIPKETETGKPKKRSPRRRKSDPAQLALLGTKEAKHRKPAALKGTLPDPAQPEPTALATEISYQGEQPETTAHDRAKPEPAAFEPVKKKALSANPRVRKIGAAADREPEFFTVAGEVGKFLQRVEKKPHHSVVITMDGEQGAGKTTTLYRFMDAFAAPGNSSLFLSLEEHPDSSLAREKATKYLSPAAQSNIDIVGELESPEELYRMVDPYDIIFVDSWQKLLRAVGNIKLDEDLRKRFDGKVFVVIFQQTTDGRTKGGAEVVFDGDIIIKMVKGAIFAENHAYFDKHRYTLVPTETIRFRIADAKVYDPTATNKETNGHGQPASEPVAKWRFLKN